MASPTERVLVVDDEVEEREALCELLSTWGFEAEAAEDGKHALEMVLTFKPGVVVLDLGLPDATGAEVVRVIREDGKARIIVFSGWHGLRDAALAAGADAFVLKPDLEALERALLTPTPQPEVARKKRQGRP